MAISTDALVALASGVVGIALGAAAGYCLGALAATVRFQRAATEDDAEKQRRPNRLVRFANEAVGTKTTNSAWDSAERFGVTDSPWDNIEIHGGSEE